MSYATRLPILTAALVLAASSAHAFTVGGQGTTGTYSGNYGSTLTDPGDQVRNFGTPDLSTPGTGSTGQKEGFSFRFGSGPFGADMNRRLAPPAWSTDPLYLERGAGQN
jgi:hypothetical protein